MLDVLLLRFDAPLMSFGGVVVDQNNITSEFPQRSQIAGLIGNALGYDHRDAELLQALQSRIQYAARQDRSGERLIDFQTVALGQEHLCGTGWTTRGRVEGREGASGEATHIRYRHYLADAVYTVAVTLVPPDGEPTIETIARAVVRPERPLFLGRKCCLPSIPLALGTTQADSLLQALKGAPLARRPHDEPARRSVKAWWPDDGQEYPHSRVMSVTDERDWLNRIHVGRRFVREGTIELGVRDE